MHTPPDLTGQIELRGSVGLCAAPCCVGSPYPLKTHSHRGPCPQAGGGTWSRTSARL